MMKLVGIDFNIFLKLSIYNDSKGNMGAIFFRIFDKTNRIIILDSLIPILIYSFLFKFSITVRVYGEKALLFICLLFLVIYFSFHHPGMERDAIVVSIVYIYCLLIFLLTKKDTGILLFCMAIQIIAISTTSDVSIAGVYLIFAFALAYFLHYLSKVFNIVIFLFLLLLVTTGFTYTITYIKFHNPYNWWGLAQSPVKMAEYSLPFPEMKYIKVDYTTYNFFYNVKKFADMNESKQMYFYPHIPIFYQLYLAT